jgi:hypothetical protein
MNGRPSASRLRSRASRLGVIATGAAGALTVGLISGVVHTDATAATTTNGSTSTGTSNTSTGSTTTTTPSSNSSTNTVNLAPPNRQVQGGSNGS